MAGSLRRSLAVLIVVVAVTTQAFSLATTDVEGDEVYSDAERGPHDTTSWEYEGGNGWQYPAPEERKRHIGSAMRLRPAAWSSQHENVGFQRQGRSDESDFAEHHNFEPEFDLRKRHLGAALNVGAWRYILGNSKRHMGAALKFRKPNFKEGQLYRMGRLPPLNFKMMRGSVLNSAYGYRYRNKMNHNRVKRDLENTDESALEDSELVNEAYKENHKRHLGAALYQGQTPWYNLPPQSYHSETKRYPIDSVENNEIPNNDMETYIDFKQILQNGEPEKRHFGAALNLVRGRPKWKTDGYWRGKPNEKKDSNSFTNMDNEIGEQDWVKSIDYKRHLGAAMKFRPRMISHSNKDQKKDANEEEDLDLEQIDKNDDVKRHMGAAMQWVRNRDKNYFDAESNDKRHFGSAMNAAYGKAWVKQGKRDLDSSEETEDEKHYIGANKIDTNAEEIDKRHLGAAMKFRPKNIVNEKRHLGSALAAGKREYDMQSDGNQETRDMGDIQEDKRHIGAALSLGKREYDENEIDKRHLGAAMRFRPKTTANEKRHIGSALAAGKRKDDMEEKDMPNDDIQDTRDIGDIQEDKRHIGAAMRFRPKNMMNEKRHLGSALAAGKREHDMASEDDMASDDNLETRDMEDIQEDKRHIGAALSLGKREHEEDDIDKRHLGAAMKFQPKNMVNDKRHIGSALAAGKRKDDMEDEENRSIEDNLDIGDIRDRQEDKRHIGAALSLGKREYDEDEVDKRHLGAAMKFRPKNRVNEKRHIGRALAAGKREEVMGDDDNLDTRDIGLSDDSGNGDIQEDKRHIGAALSSGKRGNDVDDFDKRHLGAAMKFRPRMNKNKKHLGSALAAGKKDHDESEYDFEKRYLGAALDFGHWNKHEDKRHIGAALAAGKRDDLDDYDDEISKRHLGAAMKFRPRNMKNEKRHIGSALAAGKRKNEASESEFLDSAEAEEIEKRHFGAAIKFRNQNLQNDKRHLGAAFRYWNGLKDNNDKRHLGSAMKFITKPYDESKRHIGSAMKFRNGRNYGHEKRHIGSAMRFRNPYTKNWQGEQLFSLNDEKRFKNSLSFGRWGSQSGLQTFGGPFNVQRLNPQRGKEKRETDPSQVSQDDIINTENEKVMPSVRTKRHLATILRNGSPFMLTKYPISMYLRRRQGRQQLAGRDRGSFHIFG